MNATRPLAGDEPEVAVRKYRGKAIAFSLVALVGATSTSLADAADSATTDSGAAALAPRTDGAGVRAPDQSGGASLSATSLGSAALKPVLHLGEPLHAAGDLLDQFSFSDPHRRAPVAGAAPRLSLAARDAVLRSGAAGTTAKMDPASGGVGGGAALLHPTLSRVISLVSGSATASAAAGPVPIDPVPAAAVPVPAAPTWTPQADAQADQPAAEAEPAEPDELEAAAHAARIEEAFQARPDAASIIAASAPQYVVRPYVPGAPSEAALEQLRWCESGGNYASVSSGGWYRGAYQFDFSTWDSVASRWMPHLVGTDPASAAPADQDLLASALYSERGWQPWPNCGLGL
ncbi:MAG: transglycosylase family protein [Acidimicrobiales bacterium]